MLTPDTLTPIFSILKQLSGYFVFPDDEGNEFVVTTHQNFLGQQKTAPSEMQLPLPPSSAKAAESKPTSADDVLEKINREIALYQIQQEGEIDDLGLEEPKEEGLRIRFEPLRGDLPPELQE